ncbi:MAG TPA: hypothetical protein VGL68_06570 [Solirubrobacteraceae bacterium]|jgi:hypothetical protein
MAPRKKTEILRKARGLLSIIPRRIMAFVVAVGVVVTAIGGVKALLPSPIPEPPREAAFSSISAYPEITLQHYDANAGPGNVVTGSPARVETGTVTYLLAADTSKTSIAPVSPTNKVTPPPPTIAIENLRKESVERKYPSRPGGKIPTVKLAVPYPQERPVRVAPSVASPPRQAFHHVAGALVTEGAGVSKRDVAAVIKTLPRVSASEPGGSPVLPAVSETCHAQCGEIQEIAHAATYDQDPIKAAEAVAAVFNDSRGERVGKRIYPIGAMISYTLKLDGFAHSKETLEWSLLAASSGRTLPRPWWRDVVVSHVEPTVNHETLSGTFWVPVPPERGDYMVHLTLLDAKGISYASSDSRPDFH